ncbi:hypothetical protein FPQ18DRAFT_308963 [Pyronema domesticum]|nr:hypothetical protein FPQ18DRAFT_308963 [Pyronema domesticum]
MSSPTSPISPSESLTPSLIPSLRIRDSAATGDYDSETESITADSVVHAATYAVTVSVSRITTITIERPNGKRNTMAALAEGEHETGFATVDGAEAPASAPIKASASPAAKDSTKASTNHRASTQTKSRAKPNANTNSYEIPETTDYIVIVDNQPPKVQVMSSSEPLEDFKPKDIAADCVDVVSSEEGKEGKEGEERWDEDLCFIVELRGVIIDSRTNWETGWVGRDAVEGDGDSDSEGGGDGDGDGE